MAAINRLSKIDTINEGDLFVVERSSEQEKISAAELLDWLTDSFVPPVGPRRIYDRQSVTISDGDIVAIMDTKNDIWLFLATTGGANIATATLLFPPAPVDHQMITMEGLGGNISSVTFSSSAVGVSVLTAATGLTTGAAYGMMEFIFDANRMSWISTT